MKFILTTKNKESSKLAAYHWYKYSNDKKISEFDLANQIAKLL